MTKVTARQVSCFDAKVFPEPNSGCWLWTGAGAKSKNGIYGKARIAGKSISAHRISWMIYRGSIPDGINVCHRCDNPSCVNPDHLFLGTQSDNMSDMHAKGRHKAVRPIGVRNKASKLTEEQVRSVKFGSLSALSASDVADRIGVSRGTIEFIRSGKTWGHIHE